MTSISLIKSLALIQGREFVLSRKHKLIISKITVFCKFVRLGFSFKTTIAVIY